jgi:hypothetical protein
MWFEAFSPRPQSEWFAVLLQRLLEADGPTLSLLKTNPFPNHAPRFLRARYYRYRFTTVDEHRQTGRWWNRELVSEYVRPVTREAFGR